MERLTLIPQWSSKLRVKILIFVVAVCSCLVIALVLVIEQMVCRCNSIILMMGRRHIPHTEKVGGHTTWLARLRKVIVRVAVDVVCHLVKKFTLNVVRPSYTNIITEVTGAPRVDHCGYCDDIVVVKVSEQEEYRPWLIERVITPAHYQKQMFTPNTGAQREI
jgi:hypothetical protein